MELPYSLCLDHLNLTPPQFRVGDWIGAGLILGLRWDPDECEWSYLLEAPELPGRRWLREQDIDPPENI